MKSNLVILLAFCLWASEGYAQRGNGAGPPQEPPGREVANEARDNARDAMEKNDVIEEQRRSYDEERKALRDALKAELEALGRGAKRREVDDVVKRFKEDNEALIKEQKEASEALKEAAREAQEANRANVPDGVKSLRDLLDKSRAQKKNAKDEFKKAMADAKTPEKRREVLDDHLADQRDHHRRVADDLKKLREELRNKRIEDQRRPEE